MASTCTLTLQENNFCNDKVSLQTPSLQHPNIFAIKFIYMHLLCKPNYFFMRKFIYYKEYHIFATPNYILWVWKEKGGKHLGKGLDSYDKKNHKCELPAKLWKHRYSRRQRKLLCRTGQYKTHFLSELGP